MRRGGKLVAGALMCLGLSGCALLGAGAGKAPATFDLVAPERVPRAARSDWQIVVAEPGAVRALAGDRILVRPAPAEIAYYGKAVWADRLPRLLQARLVETLQRSGRFRAVSDGSDRTEADLQLSTTINAFHIEVSGKRATANIALSLKVIEESGGRLIASRGFATRVGAAGRGVGAAVEALNAALREILPRIARWAARIPYVRVRRDASADDLGETPGPAAERRAPAALPQLSRAG